MASNFLYMISCSTLRRSIKSSLNSYAISAHFKKQIHKIIDEWLGSCVYNKAKIIVNIYIISEPEELSNLPKEVIAEFSRSIQVLIY